MEQEEKDRPSKADILDPTSVGYSYPTTPSLPPLPEEYLEALEGKAITRNFLWQQRAEADVIWTDHLKSRSLVDLANEYQRIKRGYEALDFYMQMYNPKNGKTPINHMHANDIKYFRNELIRLRSMLMEIEPIIAQKMKTERAENSSFVPL
jgi:hypothetical protein